MLRGEPASPGIGIGQAVLVKQQEIVVPRRISEDPNAEKRRFSEASEIFAVEMQAATDVLSYNVGTEEAGIIAAQIALMHDPELHNEVNQLIYDEFVTAEYALQAVCEKYIALFHTFDDELMRARAADFKDVKNRMLSILLGIPELDLSDVPAGSVLVGEEFTPSQAVYLDPHKIVGIVNSAGNSFSHISIIARALGIPTIVLVKNAPQAIRDGEMVIVDGTNGDVIPNPTKEQLGEYRKRQQSVSQTQTVPFYTITAKTADQRLVRLEANMSMLYDLEDILEYNVDGIGSFHTEVLFKNAHGIPTEEEQFAVYKKVVLAMQGKPVSVRPLGMCNDRDISCAHIAKSQTTLLKCQTTHHCPERPELLKAQLAAMLRAGAFGTLRILLPMISTLSQLMATKEVIQEVKAELAARRIPHNPSTPVGIMIETPAAAMCADLLAMQSDFFCIGTTGLTQYTLAVDRGLNSGTLYSARHPAVLRLIHNTVECASQIGIPVLVSGKSSADPLMVPLLVGAGVDGLSVNLGSVLAVRRQIEGLDSAKWKQRFYTAMEMGTPAEVTNYVQLKIIS